MPAIPEDSVLVIDVPGSKPAGGLIAAALEAKAPPSAVPPPAIGIVTMTKNPIAFGTWLAYHHDHCGVCKFYVRVEDTPDLMTLLNTAPWDDLVEVDYASGRRDYFVQMDRQNAHIERVLPRAPQAPPPAVAASPPYAAPR